MTPAGVRGPPDPIPFPEGESTPHPDSTRLLRAGQSPWIEAGASRRHRWSEGLMRRTTMRIARAICRLSRPGPTAGDRRRGLDGTDDLAGLIPGRSGTPPPGRPRGAADPRDGGPGDRRHLHRGRRRPEPGEPRRLRRPDRLRQHRRDRAGAGEGAARLRRRAARASSRSTAPRTASSTRRSTSSWSAPSSSSHGTGDVPTRRSSTPSHPIMKGFGGSRAGTRPTSTTSTTRRTAPSSSTASRATARSRGPGSARTARAASSTPPGATTSAPGATPASRTWSSAASAGRPARPGDGPSTAGRRR